MRLRPSIRGPSIVALIIATLGLAASSLVTYSVAADSERSTEMWLSQRGEVVQATTEATVELALNALTAAAAFFENSDGVTQAQFSGFVESLDSRIWLIGIAYMPLIPGSELGTFEMMKQATDPGYRVTALDENGDPYPVQTGRSMYYPVELFKSGAYLDQLLAGEENAFLGPSFDAGSVSEWRPSLEYVVATGSPSVSGFLEVGAGDQTLGQAFIAAVPVHDESGAVIAILAAPMIDLLLTTGADSVLTGGVDWTLSSTAVAAQVEGASWNRAIEFPGAQWDLTVSPTREALNDLAGIPTWIVLASGLMVTALLTYLYVTVSGRRRARGRVASMERIAAEKDRFLASVSHELRTPLTVVSGLAHELNDRGHTFEPDEVAELLGMLSQQSDEVAAIVEDLLVAARADLKMLTLNPTSIDLREEARWVVEGVGIDATVTGAARAWADPNRVRQILRNLVSNAQRYGGPKVTVRIGSIEGAAWIEVADSGPPIPEEKQRSMFSAYVTSSGRGERVEGAMGLGLFISLRLAEILRGDLSYRHDGNYGIFRLELPKAPPADGNAPQAPIARNRLSTGSGDPSAIADLEEEPVVEAPGADDHRASPSPAAPARSDATGL